MALREAGAYAWRVAHSVWNSFTHFFNVRGNVVVQNDGVVYQMNVLNPSSDVETYNEQLEEMKTTYRSLMTWDKQLILTELNISRKITSTSRRRLLGKLRGLTDRERDLIEKSSTHVDGNATLFAILSWYPEQNELHQAVREIFGYNVLKDLTDGYMSESPLSTVLHETRLRLAAKGLSSLNSLQHPFLQALHDVGCLSPGDYHRVKNEKYKLTHVFLHHRKQQLCALRAVLLHLNSDEFTRLRNGFCDVDLTAISPALHHSVPAPPNPYQHRKDIEQKITNWIRKQAQGKPSREVLVLHGMGSVGKSSLAANTAKEALPLGFHRVIWLDAMRTHEDIDSPTEDLEVLKLIAQDLELSQNFYLNVSEKDLQIVRTKLKVELDDMKCNGERILFIMDDVCHDNFLRLIPFCDAVLVTSRMRRIWPDSDDRISVDFLSKEETEGLLTNVLKANTCSTVHSRQGMWEKLQELCADGFRMPLTVRIIGGLVDRQKDEWRKTDGLIYLETMKTRLTEMKKKFRDKNIHSHNRSEEVYDQYNNVYAAIYVSFERLSPDNQNKYQHLVIFKRHETFLSITMGTIWKEADFDAKDRLEYFADCSMLNEQCIEDGRKEFVLHDLFYDLLLVIVEDKGAIQRNVIESYKENLEQVSKMDKFFFLSFINLCLAIEEHETASRCLCRLVYIMKRFEIYKSMKLMSDFQKLCYRRLGDECLNSFRDLVSTSLSLIAEYEQINTEIFIQVGLARHHDKELFRQAEELSGKYLKGKQYFRLDCSRKEEDFVPSKGRPCFALTGRCDQRPKKVLLTMEWQSEMSDFVVVLATTNPAEAGLRLCAHTLISNEEIFSLDVSSSHYFMKLENFTRNRASVNKENVAISLVDKIALVSMDGSSTHSSLSSPSGKVVVGVSYNSKGNLFALCSDRRALMGSQTDLELYQVNGNRFTKMEFEYSVIHLSLTKFWVTERPQRRLILWFLKEQHLKIWSEEMTISKEQGGEKDMKDVEEAAVSQDERRLVVSSTSLRRPCLQVFDLSSLSVIFEWKERIDSWTFSFCGDLAFISNNAIRVISGDEEMETRKKVTVPSAPRQLLLSFSYDPYMALLQTHKGILAIDLTDGDEQVLWDWRFVRAGWERDRQVFAVHPNCVAVALSVDGQVVFLKKGKFIAESEPHHHPSFLEAEVDEPDDEDD